MVLEQINRSEELRAFPPENLRILAREIWTFLAEKISHTGGHLVPNLGVVEPTIALFRTLDLPEDKVIRDAGHQSYTHKVSSGYTAEFDKLCQYGDLSEFPRREESLYDSFDTGHSSTSMSTGLGIALRRDTRDEGYRVVSVIGDGALTDGMAYETLSNTVRMKKSFIVVLNNSRMSISENIESMSRHLNGLRIGSDCNDPKKSVADVPDRIPAVGTVMIDKIKRIKNSIKQLFISGILLENMGIIHLGPVDGHNIQTLCRMPRGTQKLGHAVPVHVTTKKGKGCHPTEKNPSYFHEVGPFGIKTGQSLSFQGNPSYTDVLSRKLCQLGQEHSELVAVTAATPDGTGLAIFERKFLDRFFDVGIAKAHAVTSAIDMAAAGLGPVIAVYSSFLQRAYDQVLHDTRIQSLPVLFAVDRAGLVGNDGETHQEISDYSFLASILNMSVMAPKSLWELRVTLDFATGYSNPLAVHYPRDEAYRGLKKSRQPISYGAGEIFYKGENIALLAVDNMINTGEYARQKLKAKGYRCSLANGRFAKPLDRKMVSRLAKNRRLIATMKEGVFQGGYGLAITALIHENYPEIKTLNVAIPDAYVEHGDVPISGGGLGTDSDSVIQAMKAGSYTSKKD